MLPMLTPHTHTGSLGFRVSPFSRTVRVASPVFSGAKIGSPRSEEVCAVQGIVDRGGGLEGGGLGAANAAGPIASFLFLAEVQERVGGLRKVS